ncbi:MAG TPA: hypothetical protein GX696_05675 [Pseudomonadaceae bacterium]|nr:hypothetical protein [Pseudomonadaceae bacterium]
MKRLLPLLLVWVLVWAAPLQAHHGIANFNLNLDIEVSGAISDIAFVNPHSWLYVDVPGANGESVQWKCELRAASVLRRSGWSKDMFEIGSQVTITGSPDRFDDNTCYMGSILFANGTSMDRYGQLVEAELDLSQSIELKRLPSGVPDISGDWAAEQVVMTDPRGQSGALLPVSIATQMDAGDTLPGRGAFPGSRGTPESFSEDPLATTWERPSLLPLTPAGQAAVRHFDGGSSDNPRLRCETTNIIFDWDFDNPVNRVEQSETRITLTYGLMNLERTIHLDRSEFPGNITPTRAGYSIGRWEDDVLVVETRGFLPGILSADTRTPHSGALRVTERFSLDTENGALQREFAATDALYFTGTYTGSSRQYVSHYPWEPWNCDDRSFRTDR